MVVAFDREMLPAAQGAYDVHPLKLPSALDALDFPSAPGAAVFAHETVVHALFARDFGKLN